MKDFAAGIPALLTAVRIDEIMPVVVGPGCMRRDLPSVPGLRVWVVDMTAGSAWPHVDEHPHGEGVFILDGELIEGEQRYAAGTFLDFKPGSRHRPRVERDTRLLGFNPLPPAERT